MTTGTYNPMFPYEKLTTPTQYRAAQSHRSCQDSGTGKKKSSGPRPVSLTGLSGPQAASRGWMRLQSGKAKDSALPVTVAWPALAAQCKPAPVRLSAWGAAPLPLPAPPSLPPASAPPSPPSPSPPLLSPPPTGADKTGATGQGEPGFLPAAGEENRKEAGTDPEGFDLVSAVGCERAAHRLPTLARARAWEKESPAAQQGWESLDPAPDVDEGVDLPLPEAVQESQPLLDSFEAFEPFEPFEDVRPVPRKGSLGLLSAAISQAASEPPELEWPDSTRRASSWAESGGRSLAPLSYAAIAERDVSHLAPPLSPPDASPSVSPPDREASSPPGSDGAVGPSLADREASDRSVLLSYAAIAGSEPRAVRKHGGRGKSESKSENKSQDKTRGKSRGKQAQAGKRSKGVSAGGGKKEVSPSAVANAVLAEVEQHSEAGRLDESLSILEKTLPRLRADVGQKKVNIEGYLRLACKKAALLKRTGDLRKGAEQLEWALADYRRHEAFWPQDCHKRDLGPVLISLWESLHHTFRTREANALLPELLETFSNRPVRCCAIELRDAYYKREFLRVPELARTLRDSIRRRYPDPEWHNDYPLSYFYEGSALWSCRQQDAAIGVYQAHGESAAGACCRSLAASPGALQLQCRDQSGQDDGELLSLDEAASPAGNGGGHAGGFRPLPVGTQGARPS